MPQSLGLDRTLAIDGLPKGQVLTPANLGLGVIYSPSWLCKPQTTTPPMLETSRAAAIRTGRVVVKAGHGRLEPLCGDSKIAEYRLDFKRQSVGRARSQKRESKGMWEPLDIKGVNEILESPIERRLVGGLEAVYDCGEVQMRFSVGGARAIELPVIRNAELFPGLWLHIFPQEVVGPYRADFLVIAALNGRCKTIIVECDGEEFHRDTVKDWERDSFMEKLEYRVIRFKGRDIWRDPIKCARYVIEVANRYLAEPEPEYQPTQEPLYPDRMRPFSHLLLGVFPVMYWNWLAENEERKKEAEKETGGDEE